MRVLVVGAGIAGLATVQALAQVGIACDVVEKRPAWTTDGTGIYLPANAVRVLRLIGVDFSSAHQRALIPRQRFLDHRGRLLLDVDLLDVWGPADPCIAMPRAALHDWMRQGLIDSIRMGRTVASLLTVADRVEVAFDEGTSGVYDLVVGADGIHSGIRRLLLADADDHVVKPVGQVAWRFVTQCPRQVTTWSVMLGHRSSFLTIPIGDDQVYCYADVSVQDQQQVEVAAHFEAYAEPVGEILAGLDGVAVHHATIEEVAVRDWVFGRVVMVGDAAHATSPNMAQGAAMAVEDALVLARCLTETSDVDVGLARFQQQRRTRTDWVRDQTHRRDHTRALAPLIRNAALKIAGQRMFRANYAPLLPPP